MLVVAHVRHALQQTVAIGACSAARFMKGTKRTWIRSNIASRVSRYVVESAMAPPAVQGLARALKAAAVDHVGEGMCRLLAARREQSQQGEDRLPFVEGDVGGLATETSVPAERGALVLLGRAVAEKEEEFQRIRESKLGEVRSRDERDRHVPRVERAAEAGVRRARRGHEHMFAYAVLDIRGAGVPPAPDPCHPG
jgi:hypothetical protein